MIRICGLDQTQVGYGFLGGLVFRNMEDGVSSWHYVIGSCPTSPAYASKRLAKSACLRELKHFAQELEEIDREVTTSG